MTSIPPADLSFIQEGLRSIARNVLEAFEDNIQLVQTHSATPLVIVESLERLLAVLARSEIHALAGAIKDDTVLAENQNINALADYGLQLFADLALWAKVLNLPDTYDGLRRLGFAFGLWAVRHDAEITTLAPLVDNMAFIASGLSRLSDLEQLHMAASQIMEAVSPIVTQQDSAGSSRPWRTLILDRAIIATRSQRPLLMEQAFQCLVELLPEDAPSFFQDNMTQMNFSQYPESTRVIMEKYFQRWRVPETLH